MIHTGVKIAWSSCFVLLFFSIQAQTLETFPIPDQYGQVIVVVAKSNESTIANLQCYERIEGKWQAYGNGIRVSIGKNGLAWGQGLHTLPSGKTEKREGDGKAPSGIFRLGTSFGYAAAPVHFSFPYRQSTDRDYFVDDPASTDYNKWVAIPKDQPNNPQLYWKSVERMKRSDHLYEIGIEVAHNTTPAFPGKGSAIFMHVWRADGLPTLGCTAMPKEELQKILEWLKEEKYPILIQVSEGEWGELKFR